METFKVKEGIIITENDSGEMREGKNKIVWMPFRQFALEPKQGDGVSPAATLGSRRRAWRARH
jgi:hypothetical protein